MENKNIQQTDNKTIGFMALGGIFLLGYIVGAAANTKLYSDGYAKGVADTLGTIIFKLEK